MLIAGLGPVGATLAALLGQRGISVLALEPERAIYPLPRAAHIDHEIVRIFQGLGVVDALRSSMREAPDYEFRSRNGETLMLILRAGVMGASGWPVSFNVYQPGIEQSLRAALAGMPSVRTILGARFKGVERNDADGVTAAIEIDGVETFCDACFLIGCDGAWSPVREACGIGLFDYAFDEPWLVLDALAPDESGFPPMNLQLCDPARPTTFVHMGPGRLRWEFMLKPGEDPEIMKADAAVAALIEPWRRYGPIEVERRAVYRFHGLVANQWRKGSVFIAGDAAHQMPPFMGQGLCSGLRDAANLAWKLEIALDGEHDVLLDSYQSERDPHVRFVIEKAIEMGRLVCTLDPEKAAARDDEMVRAPRVAPPAAFPPLASGCILVGSPSAGTIFPQPHRDAEDGAMLDDWIGREAVLIYRSGAAPASTTLKSVCADELPHAWSAPVRQWLDRCGPGKAVIVRPDRYVFGSGDTETLLEAYNEWTRRV